MNNIQKVLRYILGLVWAVFFFPIGLLLFLLIDYTDKAPYVWKNSVARTVTNDLIKLLTFGDWRE